MVGGSARGNYTLTNTPGLLTINPVALTVTVANASKNYGAALPTFTTSNVTGLVNGDTVGTTITIGLASAATASSSVVAAAARVALIRSPRQSRFGQRELHADQYSGPAHHQSGRTDSYSSERQQNYGAALPPSRPAT